MTPDRVTVHVPGKLYLLGEYAVVEGYPSIVAPVSRYLTATASEDGPRGPEEDGPCESDGNESPESGMGSPRAVTLASSLFPDQQSRIDLAEYEDRHQGPAALSPQAVRDSLARRKTGKAPLATVEAAARICLAFLVSQGIDLRPGTVFVDSDLDDRVSGRKYGFGSSGASIVAVISVLLEFCGWPSKEKTPQPSSENPGDASREVIVYKLAMATLLALKDNGSGGDIAVCSFGRPLCYSRPSRGWLQKNRALPIADLVALPWPKLVIKPFDLAPELDFFIGWTGSPASSSHLVQAVRVFKESHPRDFRSYCKETEKIVESFMRSQQEVESFRLKHPGFVCGGDLLKNPVPAGREKVDHTDDARQAGEDDQDCPAFSLQSSYAALLLAQIRDIDDARIQMAHLSAWLATMVPAADRIETDALTDLIESANELSLAAKVSGAGGGDCGIAVGLQVTEETRARLRQKWLEKGVTPLNCSFVKSAHIMGTQVFDGRRSPWRCRGGVVFLAG